MAHRPPEDLEPLKGVDPRIKIGIGVIDVKVNHIETPEEVACAIERADSVLGSGRVGWIHPDCGFWMLKRSMPIARSPLSPPAATSTWAAHDPPGHRRPAHQPPDVLSAKLVLPGDREMFFTSYRTGDAQLFEISLDSGETRQLTSGAPIHPYSAALHPDGASLVITRGGELWAVDRATLAERRIFSLQGAQLGESSISADGAWLTAAFAGTSLWRAQTRPDRQPL
jgi:hypothetical protein